MQNKQSDGERVLPAAAAIFASISRSSSGFSVPSSASSGILCEAVEGDAEVFGFRSAGRGITPAATLASISLCRFELMCER